MKVLTDTGLKELWAQIKSKFLQIPVNDDLASTGYILTKNTIGTKWVNLNLLEINGFVPNSKTRVPVLFSEIGEKSALIYTPAVLLLDGTSTKLENWLRVRGILDSVNLFTLYVEVSTAQNSNLIHMRIGGVADLQTITAISGLLGKGGWTFGYKEEYHNNSGNPTPYFLLSDTFKISSNNLILVVVDNNLSKVILAKLNIPIGECTITCNYLNNTTVNITFDLNFLIKDSNCEFSDDFEIIIPGYKKSVNNLFSALVSLSGTHLPQILFNNGDDSNLGLELESLIYE